MWEYRFYNWEDQWIKRFSKKHEISENLVKLVILIEDKRFLRHKGIDLIALMRAFLRNLATLKVKQGASTISQQLFNISFLENCGNFGRVKRKLLKFIGSYFLERCLGKEEILKKYLLHVYFGQSYFGVKEAAHGYFSSSPDKLELSQSFFLAERIATPNRFRESRVIKVLRRKEIRKLFSKKELDSLYSIYKKYFPNDLNKKLGGEWIDI